MAQQLASVEYYQSRAMRNWVGLSTSRALPHGPPTHPDADALDLSAALCQIFDSIYLDIPMSRVKFNVNTEYAYLQNFKILQSKEYLVESFEVWSNTSRQAVLRDTASIDLSMWNNLSNAKCKIISSSFSGPSDIGTSTFLEVTMMLLVGDVLLVPPQRQPPPHEHLPVR
jgi:hypothetical protein